jgi:hypothetical protein
MNDRIQQLANQALQLVADEHTDGDESRLNTDSYHVKDLIQEKFAELIVGECIHQCKKDMVPDEDVVEGYDEDWNMALKHSVEQIKQHFGVKE